MKSNTKSTLFILGAGSPIATQDYFGTSQAVRHGEEYILFDCGPTTTFQLARIGIPVTAFNHLFFTHHHFDHNGDYGTFVLSRWNEGLGKIPELKVFGPKNTKIITERLFGKKGVYAFDIEARSKHKLSLTHYVNRGGKLPRRPPRVNATDVGPGKIYSSPLQTGRSAGPLDGTSNGITRCSPCAWIPTDSLWRSRETRARYSRCVSWHAAPM